jgi:hypothetical protein
MDTGATDHITSDLERLTVHVKYHGTNQVHIANGLGMKIAHIGQCTLHSPTSKIQLKNVLHVPQADKNLFSFHMTIMFSLNFIQPTLLLRRRRRRELSSKARLKEASTRYDHPQINIHRISKLLVLCGRACPCGIID